MFNLWNPEYICSTIIRWRLYSLSKTIHWMHIYSRIIFRLFDPAINFLNDVSSGLWITRRDSAWHWHSLALTARVGLARVSHTAHASGSILYRTPHFFTDMWSPSILVLPVSEKTAECILWADREACFPVNLAVEGWAPDRRRVEIRPRSVNSIRFLAAAGLPGTATSL